MWKLFPMEKGMLRISGSRQILKFKIPVQEMVCEVLFLFAFFSILQTLSYSLKLMLICQLLQLSIFCVLVFSKGFKLFSQNSRRIRNVQDSFSNKSLGNWSFVTIRTGCCSGPAGALERIFLMSVSRIKPLGWRLSNDQIIDLDLSNVSI